MNQSERRLFLIQSLLDERPSCRKQEIPTDAQRQKVLLRGLMNIRSPRAIHPEFQKIQDAYLQAETAEKGITDIADLSPIQPGLYLWQGDITTLRCDAIVNAAAIRQMLAAEKNMRVPRELVPRCPVCGRPMTMNLRCDDTFVQDEGWYRASERYADFLRRHKDTNVLFLDLGTGMNTPGIIKYPFWRMTATWENAAYACINLGEAYAPKEIGAKSICIDGDIGSILKQLSE